MRQDTPSVPINMKHLVSDTGFYVVLFCEFMKRGKIRDDVVSILGNISFLIGQREYYVYALHDELFMHSAHH